MNTNPSFNLPTLVGGRPVVTITPSDKINVAIAKWINGTLSAGELDYEVAMAMISGELAPTADPATIKDYARTCYTQGDPRCETCGGRGCSH